METYGFLKTECPKAICWKHDLIKNVKNKVKGCGQKEVPNGYATADGRAGP